MLALVGWGGVPSRGATWSGTTGAGAPVSLGASALGPAWRVTVASHAVFHAVVAGRIYNRTALVDDLGGGALGPPLDDAALLLRLWAERGSACLTALRGAFALAVWDVRRERLTVACDQLGLVPCFVTGERGRVAAAAALPALLALPGVSQAWDAHALDALLTLGCVPAPATPFLAVRQLRPGDLMVFEDGRGARRRWWQLQVPGRHAARGDVTAAVRERLGEAVRLRHAGSGVLLCSGGFGSAALVAAAVGERRLPARALTLSAARGGAEEARAAARLAGGAGVAHAVVADEPDWAAALDAALDVHGAPIVPLAAPLLAVGVAAAGSRVVVSGHGAPEVLGGTAAHRAWMALRRYRRLPGPVRELAELAARLLPLAGVRALVEGAPLGPVECLRRTTGAFVAGERAELYTPEALARLGERGGDDALGEAFADAVAAGADDPLDTLDHVALQLALPALSALHAAAAARGVELRLPFADARLAQVALAVPPDRRGSAAARLPLVQPALGRRVARAVAARPHRPLAPPRDAWSHGGLRALLDDVLAPARLDAGGVFRPEAVARLRAEHAAGLADHGARLWALALATRWLERVGWPATTAAARGAG